MNAATWAVLILGLVAAGAAIQAGNDLTVAVPAAAAAVGLVALVGVLEVRSRSSSAASGRRAIEIEPEARGAETDSLLQLRRSFRAGRMGRSSILATLRALERDMSPTGRTPLTLPEERAVLELPPDQFRRWVEERVRRIEGAT